MINGMSYQYSLFGAVDRVTCERWGSWLKAHDSVSSQSSLPWPVKAAEPCGIRTGDMHANHAAGRLIAGSQRV